MDLITYSQQHPDIPNEADLFLTMKLLLRMFLSTL